MPLTVEERTKSNPDRFRLHCPYCGAGLEEREDGLWCAPCRRQYRLEDGVPCFMRRPDYYYGEIPKETMVRLLAACRVGDWQEQFERMLETLGYPASLRQYSLSERRAGWWPLLGIRPEWCALDLGCGWGPIAFLLSQKLAHVTAVDACKERLQFLQIRARQEGASNIRLVWAGDTPRLPFGDGAFDLVVLNGVLEWIPCTREGKPEELQKQALREVVRVLSRGGQLLLAIENRYSFYYFLGKPEDHARIRFVSLLPRHLADIYAEWRTGKTYRNYTYSNWGYRRLLRSSGFSSVEVLIPLHDYRFFTALLDAERPQTIRDYLARRHPAHAGSPLQAAKGLLVRWLAPSFCVVGHKGQRTPSFVERLGAEVAKTLCGDGRGSEWSNYAVTQRDTILFSLRVRAAQWSVVVKLPLTEVAKARCRHEADTLTFLHTQTSEDRKRLIPRALLSGEYQEVPYFVQQELGGFAASSILRSGRLCDQWRQEALDFAIGLHTDTRRPVHLTEEQWDSGITPQLKEGLRIIWAQTSVEAERIQGFLKTHLCNKTWPFSRSHGDYWAGNLLLHTESGRLQGVIDWDRSAASDFPLLDMIHSLLFSRAEAEKLRAVDSLGRAVTQGRLIDDDQRFVDAYLDGIGVSLSGQEFRAYLILYWVRQVSLWQASVPRQAFPDRDHLRHYVDPARRWLEDVVVCGTP